MFFVFFYLLIFLEIYSVDLNSSCLYLFFGHFLPSFERETGTEGKESIAVTCSKWLCQLSIVPGTRVACALTIRLMGRHPFP